ncbi:MAG: hypothetical protein AAFR65_13000 [Pseudomonadota bacterium]
MVLFTLAVLITAFSVISRRFPMPAAARRRLVIIGGATGIAVVILQLFRLTPFALLALLVGAGFGANVVMGVLARRGDFEDLSEEEPAAPPVRKPGGMGREEALAVLGLDGDPDEAAIQSAHKRMIVRAHPDQGGSDYLAAKVNEARQVLLPKT